MRKNFTPAFLVAASFFVSSNAWADGSHTVSLRSEKAAWATSSQSFAMSDIAAELGTDAATLYSEIQTWKNNGFASDLFTLGAADGTWSANHGTAGDGAFYIGDDGTFHDGWSDAAAYCRLDYDEENITITMGQTGVFDLGDIKCNVALNLNGQIVTFDATLTIFVPEIDKEPVTSMSSLNIVGRYTYKTTVEPHSNWEVDEAPVKVEGICEALGIDPEYMQSHFTPMIYAKSFDSDSYTWSETLAHDFTATPTPGFWFNSGVYVEGVEEMSKELTHGGWLNTKTNMVYITSLSFDAATETINGNIGQYPDAWALGDNHTADIYIVYGDKAYVITYDITANVALDNTIDKYTNVGEETINLGRDPRKGWTELDDVELDTVKITSAFGPDVKFDDLTLYAADKYGNLTNTYTADAPGFWFSANGEVKSYTAGTQSFFVDLVSDTIRTDEEHPEIYTVKKKLSIGNMPDVFKGGEACTTTFYLINGDKYYAFNVNMTIDKPSYTIETCEVTDVDLNVKLVPDASAWQVGTTDVAYLNDVIGTTQGVFYGVNANNEITDAYSVAEATNTGGGGFWMSAADENGMAYAATYSDDGAYAIWYYNNVITWFNNPGKVQAGEVHYGTFYLANLWDGKAAKINLTIKYVNKIVEVKTDGEESIAVATRSEDGEGYSSTTVDLSKCAETLECTIDDIIMNAEWSVIDADGNETAGNFADGFGYAFNKDGYAVGEDEEQALFVGFFDDELRAYAVDDVDGRFDVVLLAKYNEKTYAFNVSVMSQEAVGISDAATPAHASDNAFYDLGGRQLTKAAKGIVINSGKKVMAK